MASNKQPISFVVSEYKKELLIRAEHNYPYKKRLGSTGLPTRPFFCMLAGSMELFFDFLTDCSLILTEIKCERCGVNMHLVGRKSRVDGKIWYCGRETVTGRCHASKSVRFNSFFTGSRLPIPVILQLVYEFFTNSSVENIKRDLGVQSEAIADWRRYCTDVLVDWMASNKEKIGGAGKTVEIDESKIGKRKFNRGHFVEGQWIFGGIERGSGRCFIVPVADRSAKTLLGLIDKWIEPGTRIMADCWKGYDRLKNSRDYDLWRVNHSLHFKDPDTGAHTNTIESTWRHFKESLPAYNRQGKFGGYIAWFMFRCICDAQNVDPYTRFLEIVRDINWKDWHVVKGGADE